MAVAIGGQRRRGQDQGGGVVARRFWLVANAGHAPVLKISNGPKLASHHTLADTSPFRPKQMVVLLGWIVSLMMSTGKPTVRYGWPLTPADAIPNRISTHRLMLPFNVA